MVKVFLNNCSKSFILEHFRAVSASMGRGVGGGDSVLFDKVFLISEEYASTNVPGNIDLSV